MPLQILPTGVLVQTPEEVRAEIVTSLTDPISGVDPNLDTSDDSVFGRWASIQAYREASLQAQILALYNALGPGATGKFLTDLALITGTVREGETFSTVTLQVTLNSGVTLDAGARVSDASGAILFETLEDVSNGGGSPATVSVDAQAVDTGPVFAPANTLTVRVSAPGGLTGWVDVTNGLAALPGSLAESDPHLRQRRIDELNDSGSANLDSIVTAVSTVAGVVAVRGFQNTTAITDVDGLSAHSFEIVTFAPTATDDDIAQTIWDEQPAGIASVHGFAGTLRTGGAQDLVGLGHAISWTEAAVVPVYAHVELQVTGDYPADGDDQIEAAVSASIGDQAAGIGRSIRYTKLYSVIYAIPGVDEVTLIALDIAPSPVVQQDVDLTGREIAEAATVTVTSTPV